MATQPDVEKEPAPPIRTCAGCGKKQSKWLLHRLVLNAEHQLLIDEPQTAPGRGAYLCGAGCLNAAIRRKALQRAFRRSSLSLEESKLEAALQSPGVN